MTNPADAGDSSFPPPGYVAQDEAGQILRVIPGTVEKWSRSGRLSGAILVRCVDGHRRKVYAIADLERLRERLSKGTPLPEGYVEETGALKMLGIPRTTWISWMRSGKLPEGKRGRSRTNKPCWLYPIEELKRLQEEMQRADRVWMEAGNSRKHHIPNGWIGLEEAAEMFGVGKATFERWDEQGLITCGKQFIIMRMKIYPVDELRRLLEECGRYSPPYPDPDRPGVYRVPLWGHAIHRRVAIIDAADLALIEGKTFRYHDHGPDQLGGVTTLNPDGPGSLHHIIMGVSGSEWRIGHLNGDGLDCRRENLVLRTKSENSAASRKAKTYCGRPCTSRFKGVCWDKRAERWVAQIKKNGVGQWRREYDDELAAAQARDEMAKELFGEHARLNFPEGIDAFLERESDEAKREAA